jgi:hypothetical protein
MEMENSSTSVAAMTNKFIDFQLNVARKKMQVILQHNPSLNISSNDYQISIV